MSQPTMCIHIIKILLHCQYFADENVTSITQANFKVVKYLSLLCVKIYNGNGPLTLKKSAACFAGTEYLLSRSWHLIQNVIRADLDCHAALVDNSRNSSSIWKYDGLILTVPFLEK